MPERGGSDLAEWTQPDLLTPPETTSYQRWIEATEPRGARLWMQRLRWRWFPDRPLISVVMPVHDVPPEFLGKAIASVKAQTYARWELCIVDDASSDDELRSMLSRFGSDDRRIKVRLLESAQRIAGATNRAAEMATGEYLAFMDHDDELSPEALFRVVEALNKDPDLELIYSDEDKLELGSQQRVEPFLKPRWSPELLTQMNYVGHLTVIRRTLFDRIGGLREGFEGSQDHDLVLRAGSHAKSVGHIPRVLYHWRKVPGSAALDDTAKTYAVESGRKAVADYLAREGVAAEVQVVMPGRYRVRHQRAQRGISLIALPGSKGIETLAPQVEEILETKNGMSLYSAANEAAGRATQDVLLFLGADAGSTTADGISMMLGYVRQPEIGQVGGVTVDENGIIVCAGLVVSADGAVTNAFSGQPFDLPYYFHLAKSVRNCTAAPMDLLMIERALLDELGGFDESLPDPYGGLDLGLRCMERALRNICVPEAVVRGSRKESTGALDASKTMSNRWQSLIAGGDRYFSPHLNPNFTEFRFRL